MPRYEALFHVAKQHFTRVFTRSKKYVILSLKGGGDMAESKLRDLSMDFSVEVLKMCDSIKGHSSITNQLERSATSVGANIHEANYAQSKADFVSKMQIALKDLEIRGAGNFLGTEQSGNISQVGFDLFAQMLKNSVEKVQNSIEITYSEKRFL